MFKINLSPKLSNDILKIEKSGNVLIINNIPYDFSSLNNGDEIPPDAIDDDFITTSITKSDDVIYINIIRPYSDANAPGSVRFPQPITMIEDGVITFNEKVEVDD